MKNSSTNALYIDGAQAATTTDTGAATKINAGRYSGGQYFWSGKLDEIRVYNRAFSAAEIAALA
jgi:hypothetical protein